MADIRAAARRRVAARDAHGVAVPGAPGAPGEPAPARARERADGTWVLAVDPSLWPLAEGDLVVADDGREWTVSTAELRRNTASPGVDFVHVEAWIRVGTHADPGTGARDG